MTAPRRSSWLIVRAAALELQRQASEGTLTHCGHLDDSGHINLAGTIDLALLARALEEGFRQEFFGPALDAYHRNGGAL